MISKYINDWLDIIEKMNNDNTYKLAWGRALLECISFDKCYEEKCSMLWKWCYVTCELEASAFVLWNAPRDGLVRKPGQQM